MFGDLSVFESPGSDIVGVGESRIRGKTRFTDSDGDSTIALGRADIGSLTFVSGTGVDSVTIDASVIAGKAKFALGGRTRFSLGSAPDGENHFALVSGVRVDRDVLYTGGSGDDLFAVDLTTIRGDVRIVGGGEDDSLSVTAEAIVGGDVRIDAGNGTNVIHVFSSLVRGGLHVDAGSGDDTLSLTGANIAGKQKIDLGGGTNTGR